MEENNMSEYKGFNIVNPPNVGVMYKVTSIGSGSVPVILRGMYTSAVEAQRDVDKYLLSVKTKTAATKEAKAKSKDK
jgi:hypothetical protein